MMNILQLQDRLKDFSKNQLIQEMQQPSGAVPPFLVLSELQRRTRMEKALQAEQAQGPQTTVAQDAIAAAGVPQGGLADMARAMAPQTDMDMNTAVQPVERMQDGGNIDGRDSGFIRRLLENVRERARNSRMTDEEADYLISRRSYNVPEFMSPLAALRDASDLYEEGDYPGAVLNAASALPAGRIVGPALNLYAEMYNRSEDDDVEGMRDGGVVRMQPGGLTGVSPDIGDFTPGAAPEIAGIPIEDFELLSPEEQLDILQYEDPTASMRARGAEAYPEYDPQRTGQGFFIETFMPTRAAQIRAGVAAARDTEAAAAGDVEEAAVPSEPSLPEVVLDSASDAEEPRLSFGDQFGDVDPAIVRRGGNEELTFGNVIPTDAAIPLALPRGAEGGGQQTPPTAGGSGGVGAVTSAIDDTFEQDKWLALAQAGLSLMASQQPNFGAALGEAGLAGITALRQARSERDERITAQQARADRLAAAAASAARRDREGSISATERAAYFRAANEALAEANALELAIERGGVADDYGMITPYTEGELAILRSQLNDAKSRANIYSGISNPSLANIQATLE